MDEKTITERVTILQLALISAHNKKEEWERDFDELDNKISVMTADGCSFEEKDKVVSSMLYLKKCVDGWQETIDHIRDWQDEIKAL